MKGRFAGRAKPFLHLAMADRAEPRVRKSVTVLFCDLVGSTTLGESLDPETNRSVVLRYFDVARAVLEHHGGTVEKFIGDAVVAVFGVPRVHEDDALRAVKAADELRTELDHLNEELEQRWSVRLAWRIGVHTGEAVVGDPTSTQTIGSGDVFNVAARLQQAAQAGEILLGAETYDLVRPGVRATPLESLSVKGKREPVMAWRLEEVRTGADQMLRRLDSPLVGREREQDALHVLYREAIGEQACRLVTIVGAAGIGKTRLAQEFAAGLFDATVARGRCLQYGDSITFFPIVDVVRGLLGLAADGDPEAARTRIALLVDEDEAGLVADRIVGLLRTDAKVRADELFWAVRKLLEAVARTRPLVVVLEDLHWAEPTLLDFVEHMVGWSRGAPLLVLGLARPELLELRASWPGERLLLEPLGHDEVRSLLANLLGTAELDPRIAQKIEAAAEGNPLFIEELTRMLAEDGTLVLVDGRWMQSGAGDLSVPPSIGALLAARLDRLDPEEQTVLQCASVIGKQFWWSAVAELAPSTLRDRVGAHLHSLVRKQLLFPAESTFVNEDSFRFGHVLVRDAAYAALTKASRAELHERFADWLQRKGAYEELRGNHLERAYATRCELGPLDEETRSLGERAGVLLASAGRRAFAREDMPAAATLLSRAAGLLSEGGERREAMRELSAALWIVGEHLRAEEVLEELLESAAQAADRRIEWYARLERAGRRHATGASQAGDLEAVARDAIAVFDELGDDLGLARAWRRIAFVAERRCSYSAAAEASERALVHAARAEADQEEARAADRLCMALLYGPTPVPDAIRRCEEILGAARPNLLTEANVLSALAGLRAMIGSFDTARAAYRRAHRIYDELGLRLLAAGLTVISGPVELAAGDPAAAEAELRFGIQVASEGRHEHALADFSALLAATLLAQRRNDEAAEFVELSRRTAGPSDVAANVVWRSAQARLANDCALALEAVDLAAGTDALNLQADAHATLAEVYELAGRPVDAATERDVALALYVTKGNTAAASLLAPAARV